MKLLVFGLLVLISVLVASIYGALYDELIYSVSKEFFVSFRFNTIDMDTSLPDWVKVALVGIINTWKAGLLVGTVLSLVGFIQESASHMFKYTMHAFLAVIVFAIIFAVIAILTATTGEENTEGYSVVERMNNFSYIGALTGMFVGAFYQILRRKKEKRLYNRD